MFCNSCLNKLSQFGFVSFSKFVFLELIEASCEILIETLSDGAVALCFNSSNKLTMIHRIVTCTSSASSARLSLAPVSGGRGISQKTFNGKSAAEFIIQPLSGIASMQR